MINDRRRRCGAGLWEAAREQQGREQGGEAAGEAAGQGSRAAGGHRQQPTAGLRRGRAAPQGLQEAAQSPCRDPPTSSRGPGRRLDTGTHPQAAPWLEKRKFGEARLEALGRLWRHC